MRKLFVTCIFLFSCNLIANGQQIWSSWQELYSDNAIKVSIRFKLVNSCESETSQSSKFAYKITGNAINSENYLVWKSDFINCNGQLFYYERSVKLADIQESGTLESMDFSFEAKELITPYYDVKLSNTEKNTSGIKAMPNSVEADRIIGDSIVCKSTETTLIVDGGSLGIKSDWIWYSGNCGNTKIGSGKSIVVKPDKKTKFYVRAEGELNTTNCVTLSIDVVEPSIEPTAIIFSKNNPVCEGETISLSVEGGKLEKGSQWVWYDGSYYGSSFGTGASINYTATTTKNICVRAEGVCISTKCINKLIEVNAQSQKPYRITYPNEVFRNKKTLLSISGGMLGEKATWEWYKGECGVGRKIGSGPLVYVRPDKSDNYFVMAKGLCNQTECVQATIATKKAHVFDPIYAGDHKKILNLGLGFGVEGIYMTDFANYSYTINNGAPISNGIALISFYGIGVKGEFSVYPIIKPVFSLGFIGSYNYSTIPSAVPDGGLSESAKLKKKFNSYSKIDIGTELCLGFNPIKFIFKANGILQANDVEVSISSANVVETYNLNKDINRVTLGGGIRIGRYARYSQYMPKKANNFDFIYSLSNYYPTTSLEQVQNDIKNVSNWTSGVGFSWWRQSSIKLQLEVIFNNIEIVDEYNSKSKSYPYYQVTFIYIKNWFY